MLYNRAMQFSRKGIIIFIIAVLVLVVLGIWIGKNLGNGGASGYSAVYLTTGDIYFGKFSWFPTPHISEAWYLQRGTDSQNRPTVSVVPLKNIPWGTSNTLYLSNKQIVMWTPISADSQFAKALANPDSVDQPGQIPVSPTTTTGR